MATKKTTGGLPKLKWDDNWWAADVVLPAWKGFLNCLGPYNSVSSRRKSTGKARLQVLTEDNERVEPTAAQQRAWAELVTHQEALRDAMFRPIAKEFARVRPENASLFDDPLYIRHNGKMPERISQPDELRKLIGLSCVYINVEAKAGVALVGYGFGCEWEDEHGLGVLTHRRRVLAVGHEEVAYRADEYEALRQSTKKGAAKKKSATTRRRRRPLIAENIKYEAAEGNLARVKKLLAAGASPEKRYDQHANAIETAALHGQAEILTLLLAHATKPVTLRPISFHLRERPEIKKILEEFGVQERW